MVEGVEGRTWVLGKGRGARGPCSCEEVGPGGMESTHDLGREVGMGQEGGA